MEKKNHHYVWRYFLKQWATGENIICLWRRERLFGAKLKKVASEHYFYKIGDLEPIDFLVLDELIIKKSPEHLQKAHRDLVEYFRIPQLIIKFVNKRGLTQEEVRKLREDLYSNILEDIHTKIEQDSGPALDSLVARDTAFWQFSEVKAAFLLFLCAQYFRTNRIQRRIFESVASIHAINVQKIWPIMSIMHATNVSFSVFVDKKFIIILLTNETDLPFITSDQPVINTYATGAARNEEIVDLEFYYPVSPKTAILITAKAKYQNEITISMTRTEVEQYNDQMEEQSDVEMFSNNKDSLKKYVIKRS